MFAVSPGLRTGGYEGGKTKDRKKKKYLPPNWQPEKNKKRRGFKGTHFFSAAQERDRLTNRPGSLLRDECFSYFAERNAQKHLPMWSLNRSSHRYRD